MVVTMTMVAAAVVVVLVDWLIWCDDDVDDDNIHNCRPRQRR